MQESATSYSSGSVIQTSRKSNNGKVIGIVSLVCGILSLLSCGAFYIPQIVAIVCGVLSKNENGKITKTGIAGIICGIISIVIIVLAIIAYVLFGG